jgi:hypothetical protein
MSDYKVVRAVSNRLRDLVWDAIEKDQDPDLRNFVQVRAAISLANPKETRESDANRLSLWLYHVTENEFEKNQPPPRSNGHDPISYSPLALNLFYLITPFGPADNTETLHLLLGRVMQILHDNAIVPLFNPLDEIYEELHIVLCRLSLEELGQIWEALREPYRLSVCYQVSVAHIDSQRARGAGRVTEATGGYREKARSDMGLGG